MRRRQFIALLSGAAATWPLTARAQREPLRRVAILFPIAKDTPGVQEWYPALLKAIEQLGWTDGRNVQIRFVGLGAITSNCAKMQRNW